MPGGARHTLVPVMPSLGPDWMDPQWLLDRFGGQFFWVSVAIVFIECGLLFPILPGDSLLFAVGLFIARGDIDVNIVVACVILSAGGVPRQRHRLRDRPGDRGAALRARRPVHQEEVLRPDPRLLREARRQGPGHRPLRADRAHLHHRRRRRRAGWTVATSSCGARVGAVLWATGITLLGYFLGGVDVVHDNLEVAVLVIVVFSVLPMVYEFLRHRSATQDRHRGGRGGRRRRPRRDPLTRPSSS